MGLYENFGMSALPKEADVFIHLSPRGMYSLIGCRAPELVLFCFSEGMHDLVRVL